MVKLIQRNKQTERNGQKQTRHQHGEQTISQTRASTTTLPHNILRQELAFTRARASTGSPHADLTSRRSQPTRQPMHEPQHLSCVCHICHMFPIVPFCVRYIPLSPLASLFPFPRLWPLCALLSHFLSFLSLLSLSLSLSLFLLRSLFSLLYFPSLLCLLFMPLPWPTRFFRIPAAMRYARVRGSAGRPRRQR